MRRKVIAAGAVVAVAAGAAVFYAADVGPPRMDQDSADLFTATVNDDAVAFYTALCPALRSALDASDEVSLSVEAAVAAGGDTDAARVEGAGRVADRLYATADQVRSAHIPATMYDPSQSAPRDLARAAGDTADALDAAGRLAADDQVRDSAVAVGDAVSALTDAAPLTNDVTVDAVAANEVCDSVFFRPGRVGEDVYPAAVDFHVWAAEASDVFEVGSERLTSESEYADMNDVASAWRQRAAAARDAAEWVARWEPPAEDPDGVFDGYVAARDGLVQAYRAAAGQADEAAEVLAVTDPSAAQATLEEYARGAGEVSTQVSVASLRASRTAKVPNEATRVEIDARRDV